jgi:hypothetical protein
MKHRLFLILLVGLAGTAQAATKTKSFAYKIKTKSGGIVGNVVIQAKDSGAANVKLTKRYPGCSVLSVQTR